MEDHVFEKCLRCNRKLTSQEAKQRGYGGHCWNLHIIEVKKNQRTLLDKVPEIVKSIKSKKGE